MNNEEVLSFWFGEVEPSLWFQNDGNLDKEIEERFGTLHQKATKGELWQWRDTIRGRLAEIILLDQFSRNLYRGQAEAFANDSMALVLAQEAIRTGETMQLTTVERSFLYMPFMHSESLEIHEIAMELFREEGMEENMKYEKEHRDIIARFGRFPHRNQALNRVSSSEEEAFMKEHQGF